MSTAGPQDRRQNAILIVRQLGSLALYLYVAVWLGRIVLPWFLFVAVWLVRMLLWVLWR